MSKSEFLETLGARLASLPGEEINKSLDYYDEIIADRMEDGVEEEEAVAALGSLDEIVNIIICNTPMTTLVSAKMRSSREKSGNKALWMIAVILGSPIWLSLALAAVVTAAALYVSVWALVIALYAVVLAFGVAALLGVVASAVSFVSVSYSLFALGAAGICAAITLFSIRPIVGITRELLGLTKLAANRVKYTFHF